MNADNYIVHKQGLRKTRLSHSPFQVFAGLVVSRETGFFCKEKPNISHCTLQKHKLTQIVETSGYDNVWVDFSVDFTKGIS